MDVGRDDFSVEPSKGRGCTSKFSACRAATGSCVTMTTRIAAASGAMSVGTSSTGSSQRMSQCLVGAPGLLLVPHGRTSMDSTAHSELDG